MVLAVGVRCEHHANDARRTSRPREPTTCALLAARDCARCEVRFRHILRNASMPVVTMTGIQFGYLLGGTVIVEQIFALPGLGRLLFTSISNRDYPVVESAVLIAPLFVLVNLVVDLLYRVIDPRTRCRMSACLPLSPGRRRGAAAPAGAASCCASGATATAGSALAVGRGTGPSVFGVAACRTTRSHNIRRRLQPAVGSTGSAPTSSAATSPPDARRALRRHCGSPYRRGDRRRHRSIVGHHRRLLRRLARPGRRPPAPTCCSRSPRSCSHWRW